MPTEAWDQTIEICHQALELTPTERAAFLQEVCAEDADLLCEVEALLKEEEAENSFLQTSAAKFLAQTLAAELPQYQAGDMIGNYKLVRRLGSGGMGDVWLVGDLNLHREVALKLLPITLSQNADWLRRFKQEAYTASSLNHENIVTIHDIRQDGEQHFIVMEYAAGQTLRERLTTVRIPMAEAIEIARQVATALMVAHQSNIIHRDIKPENIMIRQDDNVKVLDFGLAKLSTDKAESVSYEHQPQDAAQMGKADLLLMLSPHQSVASSLLTRGIVMGTVNYMSPEQARGEVLTGQSDVFSLGQVLLEMVCGKSLFAERTAKEVLQVFHDGQELLAPANKLEGVPHALEQIIRKSLRRDLKARYATAREMLVDLQRLQRRAATKRLRRGVMAGIGGMLLLLLLLVVSAWYSVQETWSEKVLSDGHTSTVLRAVFSPDGKRLVSVSQDRRVMVWDFARRELIQSLTAHQDQINSVSFSPDGKWFATGSHDKTVIVWNAATLQPEKVIAEHQDKVMAVAFSPDGKWLASASGSDTGASRDYRTVLWNVNGWQKVREFAEGRTYGNLLFSPDGRWLKTQDSQWDVATGNRATKDGDGLGWNWNEFAPDAKQLLGAGAGGVEFYQLAQAGKLTERKSIGKFSPHQDFVRAAAYSPNGKLAATGAGDIVLWDTAARQLKARFPVESSVWSVTFSPDSHWLVSTHGDGTMLVWNLAQQRREFSFNAHAEAVRTVAVSPDGKRYASAGDDRNILVWNAETGAKDAVLIGHNTRVINLVFSPDGTWLASLDQTGRLIRWELERRTAAWDVFSSQGASCLAVSPDGKWLVTRHAVIKSADGKKAFGLGQPETDLAFLGAAAFSSDGKWLAGVEGNQLLLMDWQNKRIVDRQTYGNAPLVTVRFSPDNTALATGSTDGTLLLWDARPLQLHGLLGKHAGQAGAVSFSPDGKFLASASADKTVKLWDVYRQELLREVGIHASPVAAVAFSLAGNLLTGEQDRSVRVYQPRRSLWGWQLKE